MRRTSDYVVHEVFPDGSRRRVASKACGLTIELDGGAAVEVDLSPHPTFRGQVTMIAPSYSRLEAGNPEDQDLCFEVRNGGANVLHVAVVRSRDHVNRTRARTAKKGQA